MGRCATARGVCAFVGDADPWPSSLVGVCGWDRTADCRRSTTGKKEPRSSSLAAEEEEMTDLAGTAAAELAGYYEKVRVDLHKWVDPLSQQQFWKKPYPYGNSVGHLVLHLTGNLNYYIGARVAENRYIRDRDREFNEPEQLDKEKVLQAFDGTIDMVVATVRGQKPGDWLAEYSAEREPEARNRFAIFLRCAAHAYHHVGQIIYLTQEVARQSEPKTASA